MLSSETLPLNVRIILSDPFSDSFYSYAVCVYNHYRKKNQNFRLMMVLTCPVSCVYDAFSSYFVSISFGLLWFLSFYELDFFDDESEDDGSGSGSPGTCAFSFCFGNSVGRVSGVGSGIFFEWNRVNRGLCSVGCVCSKRSLFQSW